MAKDLELRPWTKGDTISAQRLNQRDDVIRSLMPPSRPGGLPRHRQILQLEIAATTTPIADATGRYNGRSLRDRVPDPNAVGPVVLSDLGSEVGTDDVIIWWPGDIGLSGPSLDSGIPVICYASGAMDKTGKPIWIGVYAYSADIGEFQYMIRQMVTDNGVGWDFLMAHPALP